MNKSTLPQINEGDEILNEIRESEIRKIEREIEKLTKRKSFYEKDIKCKLESHLKIIHTLKNELKKKDY